MGGKRCGESMTRNQRALIGLTAATVVSLLAWALIGLAFAQMPPRAFRGPVQVTVQFTSAANVEGLCGMITEGRLRGVEACANNNVIIAPNPCGYPGRYASIMCHEITCHVTSRDGDPDHRVCRT